jgi:hypothetical protein
MSRAKKDRRIVKAGHEPAQTPEDGADRHHQGNQFLEAGKSEPPPYFDMPAIPKEFLARVDAQPAQILE